MYRFLLLLAIVATASHSHGQTLKKYPISTTGNTAYFYCDPGQFDQTYSPDSSKVYTAECLNDGIAYGLIYVQLKEPVSAGDEAESLLIMYLDYLKSSFNITSATGYGKGHRLRNREEIRGVIDYWMDKEKDCWKVKGWTNGNFLAVLYAYGPKQKTLPETKVNVFLDGFRIPGM